MPTSLTQLPGFSLPFAAGIISSEAILASDQKVSTRPDRVEQDYRAIRATRFAGLEPAGQNERKLYLATAGAPASGKSTELDLELDGFNAATRTGSDTRYANAVRIDPDRYTLLYMSVYQDALGAGRRAVLGQAAAGMAAYELARPASNSYAYRFLNQGVAQGYHLAHGTTGTSASYKQLLFDLGAQGYERRLLLCGAAETCRDAAKQMRQRVEGLYQVSDDDFVQKAAAFTQRHIDLFSQSDDVVLMWKSQAGERARRAADYHGGVRTILDQSAFKQYVDDYEARRDDLALKGASVASWDKVEDAFLQK